MCNNYIKNEYVFCENSKVTQYTLRERVKKEKILKYECEKCGNDGLWNNYKITLQLDHRNGLNNDNRIENLRYLCPNCHSQTETFAGRNTEKVKLINSIMNIERKIEKEMKNGKN